jgi:hypothetical protein
MFRGLFSNITLSYSIVAKSQEFHDHTSMLQPLLPFESIYLGKSLSRLLDPVNSAFSTGNNKLASRDDVDRIVRVISSELEIAKFDLGLIRNVTNNVRKALVTFSTKCEAASSSDQLFNVSGNGSASLGLQKNIEIVNGIWRISEGVWGIVNEYQRPQNQQSEDGAKIAEVIVEVVGNSVEVLSSHSFNSHRVW